MQQIQIVTPEEVRTAFRQICKTDREANLENALHNAFADDLKPVNKKGKWNPSALLFLLICLFVAFVGVFLYFTFTRPSV